MLTRVVYLAIVLAIGAAVILIFRIPQLGLAESGSLTVLGPVQSVLAEPIHGVEGVVQTIRDISTLRQENARLQAEVDRLQSEVAQVPELQRENQDLRDQLGLRTTEPQFQFLPASIIGYDTSNLVKAIIVNRGTGDNVAEGMTVVTPSGLAGQVIRVNQTTAKILLITDVSSSVNGLVQGTRARGVVIGGAGKLVMQHIPQGEKVNTGDRVITSGLGGYFPEGLLIGSVTDVRQKDVDVDQEARLEPAVDFGRLETVLIILNYMPVRLE